jgi:putative oxidoreductase
MLATRYLPFVGRLMIGLPFAMSGLSKLGAYSVTTGMIEAVGLPFPPLAFAVAVATELGGGLLLIAGYRARYVAAALVECGVPRLRHGSRDHVRMYTFY